MGRLLKINIRAEKGVKKKGSNLRLTHVWMQGYSSANSARDRIH
jgi:hypothetical protein